MKKIFYVLALLAAVGTLQACSTKSKKDGSAGAAGENVVVYGDTYPSNPSAGSQGDLAINIGDRVFFGYDSSVLTAEAQATLNQQLDWLKKHADKSVTIEGHCDERGTREYNLALGERRAAAVKNYLVGAGLEPSRVSTTSFGKERPAVMGSDESAWRLNRRSVTVIN